MSATLTRPRSIVEPVYREDDPAILGGYHHKHWDGSQDATVFAKPIKSIIVNPDTLTPKQREMLMRGIQGGAFNAAGGMYAVNWMKVLDATQLAFAFLADTVKMALYTNSIAATSYYADVAIASAPYNANEASGTGYTAAGLTLANKTISQSPNGTVMLDNTVDPAWTITGSLATAVRGFVVHDTTIASNGLICAQSFGSDYNVTNGTLTVQLNSLGINTLLFAA